MKPVRPRRFCVAPMMDWTDRHCRYFHRQISSHAFLYTEMVTTGALMHGDVPRHLDFDAAEHPVALQLGGSEPADLARSAKLGAQWGYAEINLNCGCPSERVQRGAFGACLMAEPGLVADCVKAMCDAVAIPVTVKHRIGIDQNEDYSFVRDFVGTVSEAGCATFIVHARNAWLKGLSPKENREVPPLRYGMVYQLKREFPQLEFILNGGLTTFDQIDAVLPHVDGVMLGREAYHNPYLMARVDTHLYGVEAGPRSRSEIALAMVDYAARYLSHPPVYESGSHAANLRHVVRHMLGLYQGMPGARSWRRMLSDAASLDGADAHLIERAMALVGQGMERRAA